ncbi:hypothetical protein AMK59_5450 [Oryctes borbonicus]|uniref:Uncharacterized protein n=1 Tax=Oryctes borbonicus TaxID=1629725 RepID=A0A0T6B2K1_9SCAR|nr:hypothetical protein AMK59_5450 [Oryctes borbonicus]
MACEHVLKTMKKGRETLLTLLEAFVYDPLVDWTLGVEGLAGTIFGGVPDNSTNRQTRKDLEKEVTLSMFSVRCTEVNMDWQINRNDILEEIPEAIELVKKYLNEYKNVTDIEELLQDLHQQMALVKEAEANGICKHPLYSLPTRYDSYKKTQDAINNAKKDLENIVKDCEMRALRYSDTLRLLEGQQFTQWSMELNASFDMENVKVYDIVKDFLQNAGQSSMITQCEQSERDIEQLAQQQIVTTIKCLQLLQEYAMIVHQCPPIFIEKHRVFIFPKWCKYLQESKGTSSCDVVFQEFCQFLENKYEAPVKNVFKFAFLLNTLYNETAQQLAKLYEDLKKVHTDEPAKILERNYNDAKTSMINFLKQEKGSCNAYEFVIVSELLLLNQSFLSLETAASRRGDWHKVSTRESVWFLDDLTNNSNKAMELISYLQLKPECKIESVMFTQILNGLKSANNMYKSLQELNYNFHTIILPESIKKIQSDDASVMQIVYDLQSIINDVGMPLSDIILHLENNLKYTVMEMDICTTGDYKMEKLKELKLRYEALLHATGEVLSPGKMLLMGFNGLFQKINLEYNNLINMLSNLDVPTSWKKLDQVKEAKSLAGPIFNSRVKLILDDIFLIKRIQTISDFFNICLEMCQPFKDLNSCTVYNDDHIVKPIRKFIADYISRQFLGITTETIAYAICSLLEDLGLDVGNEIEQKDIGAENKVPLDELSHKGWSSFLKHGIFTQNILAQASSLETNLKTAWERMQEPKKIEQNLALVQSSLIRIQQQITTCSWMFEDILNQHGSWYHVGTVSNRSKFIVDLQNESAALNAIQIKLAEMQEQQKPSINSVAQRLKWAAGANPDLNAVLTSFESALADREKKFKIESQITTTVLTTCNTILQHELLRSHSPDSKSFDQHFLNSCEKWRIAATFNTIKLENVSEVEENIMKLYTPDLVNNPKWLSVVSEKISDIITGTQNELEDLKNKKIAIIDELSLAVDKVRPLYTQHCKLMTDFKSLIKALTKIEEYASKAQKFVSDYKRYIDTFTSIFTKIKSGVAKDDMEECLKYFYYLEETTTQIYNDLINLISREVPDMKLSRNLLTRQDGMSLSPVRSIPQKQESMTKGQQRNAYAVGVWRRVRQKLEGRDPDPGRKYTIQEQVEYVIREATSLDNLALLYEGWTPWV